MIDRTQTRDTGSIEAAEPPRKVRRRRAAHSAGDAFNAKATVGGYIEAVHSAQRTGHGVIAEDALHKLDVTARRKAQRLGGNNARWGPDRIVNGVEIQTKYYKTGEACVSACFQSDWIEYKYFQGKELWRPMPVEVPADQYDSAIAAMKRRIEAGHIIGIDDPAAAYSLVRKGRLTYEQARNLGRAGTIESVTYDAATGAVSAASSMGLSAAVEFATRIWEGEPVDVALAGACRTSLEVGGTTIATHIIAKQLGRTSFEKGLVPASEWVAKKLGTKAAKAIARASGKKVSGAAATRHAAKILRGNAAATVATGFVLSTADIYRLVNGSISGSQAAKNIGETLAGVAGGAAGWTAGSATGAAIGTMIAPGAGTAVGAFVGGILGAVGGGAGASKGASWTLDKIVEDDAVEMLRILEEAAADEAAAHLLTKFEVEALIAKLSAHDISKLVREIYKSKDRKAHCRALCAKLAFDLLCKRRKVGLPAPPRRKIKSEITSGNPESKAMSARPRRRRTAA